MAKGMSPGVLHALQGSGVRDPWSRQKTPHADSKLGQEGEERCPDRSSVRPRRRRKVFEFRDGKLVQIR